MPKEMMAKMILYGETTVGKNLYWQKVRGICILAVIAIHIIAEYQVRNGGVLNLEWVLVRQFLNFTVPTFIFISGYFTNEKKAKSVKRFYFNRFQRLVVPYMIWSCLYLGLRGKLHQNILEMLITGNASWQLYYIVVLLQLAIVTPVLIKLNGGGGGKTFDYSISGIYVD